MLDILDQVFVLLATTQLEVRVASMPCLVINEPTNGAHLVLVVINTQRNRRQKNRRAIRHGLIATHNHLKVLVPIKGTTGSLYLMRQLISANCFHYCAPPNTRFAKPSST